MQEVISIGHRSRGESFSSTNESLEGANLQKLEGRIDEFKALEEIEGVKKDINWYDRENASSRFDISFETEVRRPAVASDKTSLSIPIDKQVRSTFAYFNAAAVKQPDNQVRYLPRQEASALIKKLNFDRKKSRQQDSSLGKTIQRTASVIPSYIDVECEAHSSAMSRLNSYLDNPLWSGSRPRELARMLAANGLFLLDRKNQFAVSIDKNGVEHCRQVNDNFEQQPVPKQLKARCAFCKRAFEIPFSVSFTLAQTNFDEFKAQTSDGKTVRVFTQFYFDAESHYATVCAIATYVKSQHHRRSISCPMVLGVIADDVRFSDLSSIEQSDIDLSMLSDPFYKVAAGNCRRVRQAIAAPSYTESSNEEKPEVTVTESAVTEQVEDSLFFTCYKSLSTSAMDYSDSLLICNDDHVHFGSWREHELNGRLRFGETTKLFDENCKPLDADKPVTPTIYVDFDDDFHLQLETASSRSKIESGISSVSDHVDCDYSASSASQSNIKKASSEYQSTFEYYVADHPLYPALNSMVARLETFETDAEDSKSLDLRTYIDILSRTENQSNYSMLREVLGNSVWSASRSLCERLANAGFFSIRRRDVCICFWCGLALANWRDDSDAYIEHARHMKSGEKCAFLFYQRGSEFIKNAKKFYPSEISRTKRVILAHLPSEEEISSETAMMIEEPVYNPLLSFYSTVTYRVAEREIRARKDLRTVRNLIHLCAAHPSVLSFAMEVRLKATLSDFTNPCHFLEAVWDLEARLRTVGVTAAEFVKFQQLYNEASHNLNVHSGTSSSSSSSRSTSSVCSSIDSGFGSSCASSISSDGIRSTASDISDTNDSSSCSGSGKAELCFLCCRSKSDVLLVPCRHLVLCTNCHKNNPSIHQCPRCKVLIQNYIRLYRTT